MKRFGKIFKGAGWLNILGMSVAFSAIYVILVQVNYELGYNRQIKDVDRVYLMGTIRNPDEGEWYALTNGVLPDRICAAASQVESYCALPQPYDAVMDREEGAQQHLVNAVIQEASIGVFDVFGIEIKTGSTDEMNDENSVAVSSSFAEKMGISVGDVIRDVRPSSRDHTFKVSAIFRDMPENCELGHADIILCRYMRDVYEDEFSNYCYFTYVKLNPDASLKELEEVSKQVTDEYMPTLLSPDEKLTEEELASAIEKLYPAFFPLKACYFNEHLGRTFDKGNRTTVVTLLITAVLILLVTLINYVNFFMAQIPTRLREVNTYKILGSSRGALVGHFILESGLLVALSFLLAYLPLSLFRHFGFESMMKTGLQLSENLPMLMLTLGVALVMTLSSSIYPALKITSFSPALALKGTMNVSGKGRNFRYALVAFQFIISISFVICSFFISRQYRYMMSYDMGFDSDNLYSLHFSQPLQVRSLESMKQEILKCPGVEGMSWADEQLVSNNAMIWGQMINGNQMSFRCMPVSYDFLKFLGVEIVEGRDFQLSDERSENGVFIFNETARKNFGITLQDKADGHIGATEIVGFCKDFHFRPLHYGIEPYAFYIFGKHPWREPAYPYLRTHDGVDLKELKSQVCDAVCAVSVSEYNPEDIELLSFAKELESQYGNEKNFIKLMSLFTVIAILISLMGIVGLLMYETAFRKKEVAVRRVQGATVKEILELFNRKYLMILLVSFVIAVPVSWLLMAHYLKAFACRIQLSWWVFVVAMLVVLLVTVLVVTLCTWRSANLNPAEALKDE